MKRVATWILALIGIPAVAIGLLVADAAWRAVRAVDAENARLRADIEARRSRRPGDISPQARFEQGHAGTRTRSIPHPGITPLAWLATLEPYAEEGGYVSHSIRRDFEMIALTSLRTSLQKVQPATELQAVLRELDRLSSRRPAPADLMEDEHLLDRASLLDILTTPGDAILVEGPGWKEFFSWKVLVVKSLRQIEQRKQDLMQLKSESLADWEEAAKAYGLRIRHEEAHTRSRLCSGAASTLQSERQARLHWIFTRVAARIALHRAEHGRLPATLNELGDVPPSPYDGAPFSYIDGVLKTSPTSLGPQLTWDARR